MTEDLKKRAEAGDPDAQAQMAYNCLSGPDASGDLKAAMKWLRLAAEGGHAWAQTEYAIKLRATKDPQNQTESIHWLKRASEQGYTTARFTLGGQQYLGIGTEIDYDAAMINLIMASLDGEHEAKKIIDGLRGNPNLDWQHIVEEVKWADLMFCMGPLLEGHLEGLTQNRLENPYDSNAAWMQYEREVAEGLFMNKELSKSFFSSIFGEEISCTAAFTGIASIGSQPLAVTTISLRNLSLDNGVPVYWKPDVEKIEAQLPALSLIEGREYIRYNYVSF